jgi:nickel-dependent lactate racemase
MLLLADEILVFTENLSDDQVRNALMTPIRSLDAGLERALQKHGPDARVAVMPQGPYLIAEVAEALGA